MMNKFICEDCHSINERCVLLVFAEETDIPKRCPLGSGTSAGWKLVEI